MNDYYRPILSVDPAHPATARRLAEGWAWVEHVEILRRDQEPRICGVAEIPPQNLAPLLAPRQAIGGLSLDRPRLMGILNVTPDSFSDGGQHDAPNDAVARARRMQAEGADIVDVGGESTRPGAPETPTTVEIARTEPVLRAIQTAAPDLPLSLDTRKAPVARAGIKAGAAILNDVSGLRFDADLAQVAAETGAPLILMHSIGTPETMQDDAKTAYTDVLLDVYDGLADAIARAEAAGVERARIIVDPGIGFGKTQSQNLALIARLSLFHSLGCPILLGVSRKGFIGALGQEPNAAERGPGSAGVGLWALSQGVQILRVHDIRLHRQAIALWWAAHGGSTI